MKKWLCTICGLIYDEAKGWPSEGIPPGTRWEDVPDDWLCPDCGVGKADFEMIELKSEPKASAPVSAVAEAARLPIVIVGSGYAGYGLAEAIRQRDASVPLVVFTADDGQSYSKPSLSNALARGKGPDALVSETPLALEQRLDLRIYSRCRVRAIDSQRRTVATDAGELAYSKLVLALGAEPIRLPIAGTGAEDVLSVNDLQDYRRLRTRLDGCRRVTLIGNGLIGCEFANDMAAAGYEVDVVGLDESPMSRLLPEAIGCRLQQALQARGVRWFQGNTVERIERQDGGYRVSLRDGSELETDLVVSAVGLRPRTELAESIGAELGRGIRVNGGLRTTVPDVFALGDCVEINGQLLPYIAPINHGIRALADTVLGKPTMAQYPRMPVIVKTPALPLTLLPPAPDTEGQWQVESEAAGQRALFVDAAGLLQGFVLAGELVGERQYWLDRCGTQLDRSVA